jgi:hypothetical protein
MGEFLLSFLGFDDIGNVIYTGTIKASKFKIGDKVHICKPNPNRPNGKQYYRIYDKFYDIEEIVELIKTQNPQIIDKDFKIPYQRHLQDADIYNLARAGNSFLSIGQKYGWHHRAVELAVQRYQTAILIQMDGVNENELTDAKREPMDILVSDNEPTHAPAPPHITDEERERLLAVWGD